VGPGYYFYLEGLVGFDEGGRWTKCRGVGVVMNIIDFPLCLRNFFGKLF